MIGIFGLLLIAMVLVVKFCNMKVITICGSLKFQKEMMIVAENWL